MNVRASRRRATAVLTAVALGVAAPLVAVGGTAAANAAPARTATSTAFTDTTFLQDALGLPTTDTTPAIESVTYDRFQWLLQQPGKFAILIGDPAEDPTFKARAQDVETAAKAAGVKKVYWFDPNLSGSVKVGSANEPNLDIRNPAGITSLTSASQTIYGYAWDNLVSADLGNGIALHLSGVGGEGAKPDAVAIGPNSAQYTDKTKTPNVTVTITGTSVVNDYGSTPGASTEVGNPNGGALYDYSSGSAPANVSDSYFFVYNKDNQVNVGGTAETSKIVSWVDLSDEAGSPSAQTDVTTAVGTVGASNLTELDQFDWWKSEVNAKELAQAPGASQGGNVPVLSDADNNSADGGWRVDQITYPELVDLLKKGTDATATILFGGTWCPNTRPVLPFINKDAQQNNVTVFNFDTVLDGGTVGGTTTSQTNPLQTRNYVGAASSSDPTNSNPTFLYGDLISSYLSNLETQYEPTLGTGFVSYYPGGNTAVTAKDVRKLQVPFLIGYQSGAGKASPSGGVTRQWIQQNLDVNGLAYFTEYMSDWWYTNPQPNELGLSIPLDAAIWPTLNSELASFTWQSDPTPLYPDTTIDSDDAQYLGGADTVAVTGTTSSSLKAKAPGSTVISPAALSTALAALGASAPTNLAAAKAALLAADAATPQDPTLIANLTTVYGAWSIAQSRKNSVIGAWGNSSTPGSISGGLTAVHALEQFFGGLPGGVVSTQTVAAPAVAYGAAPQVNVTIANDYGRIPTGDVTLTIGGASYTQTVAQNSASFSLPNLTPGAYSYTLSYPGDDQIVAFTNTGSLTVGKGGVSGLSGAVVTAPTTTKAGSYKVSVVTASGLAAATGNVTVTLKSGKTSKALTGTLANGAATIAVPKLAAGSWTVALAWAGDADYANATATAKALTVAKSKVSKVSGTASTKPTSTKAGKFKVTVTAPKGLVKASGKVTVKVAKKGAKTKSITGTVKNGTATLSVPKLAKGTWSVTISWAGDANYLKASGTSSIKVTK